MHSPTMLLPDWTRLSLAEQVAQMVVVRASGHLFDHQIRYPTWEPPAARLQHWIQDLGVGGVILLGGSAAEVGMRSQQLQSWASIPLLMAADIEEGVGQRFAGATWFPPPMAIAAVARQDLAQALEYARVMGAATAREALAIGLNWVLAPVVDVNNNPSNPVINVRAFGDEVELVSQLTVAFLQGAHEYPVLTAAKHFPGHGDTATDSHLALPVIPHDRDRLNQLELVPFQRAIAAGVDAVMSGHLLIPALDPMLPATLSPQILTRLLRRDLGFEGLVVTDALVMGAIANQYGTGEACVLAVEAGTDILLMPLDAEEAITSVVAAVESGRISPERIQASVERIGWAKQRVGAAQLSSGGTSHAWETVPPPPIRLQQLAQPEAIATAKNILRDSMQRYVPTPLPATEAGRNLIVLDDSLSCSFLNQHSPAIALPAQGGYRTLRVVDSYTPQARPENLERDRLPTLLQLFVRGNPFRSSAALTRLAQDWLLFLAESQQLQGVALYGSPYVLEQVRSHLPGGLPYVFTYGQMPDAQTLAIEALFGSERTPPALNQPQVQVFTD